MWYETPENMGDLNVFNFTRSIYGNLDRNGYRHFTAEHFYEFTNPYTPNIVYAKNTPGETGNLCHHLFSLFWIGILNIMWTSPSLAPSSVV